MSKGGEWDTHHFGPWDSIFIHLSAWGSYPKIPSIQHSVANGQMIPHLSFGFDNSDIGFLIPNPNISVKITSKLYLIQLYALILNMNIFKTCQISLLRIGHNAFKTPHCAQALFWPLEWEWTSMVHLLHCKRVLIREDCV